MKSRLPLLALALLPGTLRADPTVTPKPLDASFLRLYSETRGFTLGRPANPKPTPNGKHVLFLRSPAKNPKRSLFEFDVWTGKTRELLSADTLLKGGEEQVTAEEKARRERMRLSAGGFADFHLDETGRYLILPLSGKLFVFDRTKETVRELKTPAGTILDPKWSRDGKWISYVRDHDVYAYDLATDTERAVTKGGTATKTHGLAEFVAQEEMSRFTGYWWSPDSKFIAFEEADHDGVETWYVADPAKPDQKPLQQFYPRPGKKNVGVRLGIVPVTGGEPVWVEWDRKTYEYLGSVRWDKHGPLTIQVQDRKQQRTVLLRVDPATGKTVRLLEEKDAAFTNLRQEVPRWQGRAPFFAWVSEDTKGPTLELRDDKGALALVAIPSDEGFISLIHADAFVEEAAYIASKNPTEAHVYVRLFTLARTATTPTSFKPKRLGEGEGIEAAVFSENKQTFVLTRTSPGEMPRSFVHTRDKLVGELPSVAEEPAFTPKATFEKLGGDDGFYTTIIRPHDFDP
jgi:dipeptidyl-peptidase-4